MIDLGARVVICWVLCELEEGAGVFSASIDSRDCEAAYLAPG